MSPKCKKHKEKQAKVYHHQNAKSSGKEKIIKAAKRKKDTLHTKEYR